MQVRVYGTRVMAMKGRKLCPVTARAFIPEAYAWNVNEVGVITYAWNSIRMSMESMISVLISTELRRRSENSCTQMCPVGAMIKRMQAIVDLGFVNMCVYVAFFLILSLWLGFGSSPEGDATGWSICKGSFGRRL